MIDRPLPAHLRVALACVALVGALVCRAGRAAEDVAPGTDDWRYDVVHRKRGDAFRGLVLQQNAAHVRLQYVSRRPGAPTVLYTIELPAEEVDHVELLPDEERDRLRQRLDALRQQRRQLTDWLRLLEPGAAPAERPAEAPDLKTVGWPGGSGKALEFRSSHFRLISNARTEIVELAAFHLEQVYAAYARALPPRTAGAPTLILLAGSVADYQELLRGRGLTLTNPAFYDSERNQVVCACDLQRLAEEVQRNREHHAKLAIELSQREADLKAAYKGAIPAALKAPLDDARKQLKTADARNQEAFQKACRRLQQRLYHEAFHAYLANWVYPPDRCTVPRWLNEGLAQIFETAIVEVGELRLGYPDPERREAVLTALKKSTFLPVGDLIRAGPRAFQVAYAGEQQVSDRHYLTSWGLAFCLTFDRKVLGTTRLDDYVRSLHRGAAPMEAFATLVGQPAAAFEKDLHYYLQHLRPDGTAGRDK